MGMQPQKSLLSQLTTFPPTYATVPFIPWML